MIRPALFALALFAATPAMAGEAVALKPEAAASGPVTLGDLFDGAGRAASIIIGPAAQPGATIVLDAAQVQRFARTAGLDWDNASGVRRIVIHGLTASAPTPAPLTPMAPPRVAATSAPVAAARAFGAAGGAATAQALTYARNLNAGDIVQADDLVWGDVPTFQTASDAPRDADAVIGKAAKKPLRAGAAVAVRDLAMPQVIKRDDSVQVTYRVDGISLTLQGKALEPAALGEAFSIKNVASKKVIEAVAVGPGRAVVGPEADRIRTANAPSSLALR
jgi:flagella basal body P-ring formation protein FlgA